MNILITNFHPLDGGGHSTYILALASSQVNDTQVTVATPRGSKLFAKATEMAISVEAIEFPGKPREIVSIVRNVFKLRKLLLENTFDVVHVNGSPDHRLLVYTLWTLKRLHRPSIVFTKHNSLPIKKAFLSAFRYRHYCDGIIVVCPKFKSEYSKILPTQTPVEHISNGVDIEKFKPAKSTTEKEMLRSRLGLPHDQLIMVSCAGTAVHKGWHFLGRSIADSTNITAVVLGSVPSKSTFARLFPDGVPKNVVFPGMRDDVRPYLIASDCGFVLSTAIETISFACREMMACGIPVLVSDYGCLGDNISTGTGWVVRAGYQSDVDFAINEIEKSDLSAMGQRARDKAEKEFDITEFRTKTFEFYQRVSRIPRQP